MDVRLKRAKELAGYAVRLTKDEGLPTMVKRGAGFVRRRFFGKRARYLPGRKVLEAQRAEMAGKTAEDCGLPTISILTPLYNTPENYLREFLDSFVGQTAPNGQLCLADASDDAHPEVERIVREYQQKNQRIGYKKGENKGIAANTNAAEALADGEYLALAYHDDVLAPGGFPRRVALSQELHCDTLRRIHVLLFVAECIVQVPQTLGGYFVERLVPGGTAGNSFDYFGVAFLVDFTQVAADRSHSTLTQFIHLVAFVALFETF